MTSARDTIRKRFEEAGLADDRFIKCIPGEKGSRDHDTRYSEPPDGNYGIYADWSDELVELDVDDYEEIDNADGITALFDLPTTLEQESAHGGIHKFYLVKSDEKGRSPAAVLAQEFNTEMGNPSPSWGEVRAGNQYVVGAGSELDGCDKDWCDECDTPGGGTYSIKTDAEIATIEIDELLEALRSDPQLGEQVDTPDPEAIRPDAQATASPDGVDDRQERLEYALEKDDKLKRLFEGRAYSDYTNNAGEVDRSKAEAALAMKLGFWFEGDKDAVRWAMNQADTRKWADRTDGSYRASVLSGVDNLSEYYDSNYNRAAADGGADATESADGSTPMPMSKSAICAEAGVDSLGPLSDNQIAYYAWELMKESDRLHVRVRQPDQSLWSYRDGLWTQNGKRELRTTAKAMLMDSFSKNILSELVEHVKGDDGVWVRQEQFGLEPGTVAVENGLLDLDAAADGRDEDAIRDLRPEDYALTRLPVEYDPEAAYDEWAEYVEEWAEEGRAKALQEYVGYCLHIGDLPIHRALLLVGSGANGKGTFLHVVRELLGDENTSSIELQTLANEKDAVADFYGSLANIDDDLSARKLGKGLGMFKKLVAGDRVRGRKLYQEGFEYEPTGKHLYAANEVPDVNVPDEDNAFWRRWLLVEFPNYYPTDERDPMLKHKLSEPESLSGVLNWAIEGWSRALEQGHFTNEEVETYAKRERWQAWGESVDQFISECVENDPDADRITTGDAYARYKAWARENHLETVGQQTFTNKLKTENVGYNPSVRIDGTVQRGYKELGFTDEVPELENQPGSDEGQQRLN